ncbi:MAG: SDR family oxidoreductase, partial [Candidatus Hodarchaeales archaeon]
NKIIPHMAGLGGGRIITLTSITVKSPLVNFALSNTLRAGIAGLVKTAANEHARDNVLINNVCPGYTGTERVEDIVNDTATRENIPRETALQRITSGIPLKRLATVDEIADTVVFLASERASYITGQSIAVDGGFASNLM